MKLAPDGSQSVFRAESGRTNGNTFDQLGTPSQLRGGRDGTWRADAAWYAQILRQAKSRCLLNGMKGGRYNSPNDVVVDGCGAHLLYRPLLR
jgi:sugar lactone lactonase YvrE